jgi:hypothetical protein
MKQYRIVAAWLEPALWFFLVLIMIPGLLLLLIWAGRMHPLSIWFGVLWLVWIVYASSRFLTMPYRIEVMDEGQIRFIGLRTTTISPQNIAWVHGLRRGFVDVKYPGGKIRVLQGFTGFHEFITELKRANPNIEVRGC